MKRIKQNFKTQPPTFTKTIKKTNQKLEELKSLLPPKIGRQLLSAKPFYQGFHNYTYVCDWREGGKVQVRIPKNNHVDWRTEAVWLGQRKDVYYYRKGVLVREWVEGEDLTLRLPLSLNEQRKIIECLKKFVSNNQGRIKKRFNWLTFWITDLTYFETLKRVAGEELVVSHGDLNPKNIILDKNGIYRFIDFEYVRLNSCYFDAVSLAINLQISSKLLIEKLGLEQGKFNDFVYLYKVFTKNWEKSVKYKESMLYYEFQNISSFFLKKAKTNEKCGLSLHNFELLKLKGFFPEILFETEEYYLCKWQPRIEWRRENLSQELQPFLAKVLYEINTLKLQNLPSLFEELKRLETITQDLPIIQEIKPFKERIWKIINNLSTPFVQPVFVYFSTNSFYHIVQQIKCLEFDKLVLGPPLLSWSAAVEFLNLSPEVKYNIKKWSLREFGEQNCKSARVAVLYYFILFNALKRNYLNLEYAIPKLLYSCL